MTCKAASSVECVVHTGVRACRARQLLSSHYMQACAPCMEDRHAAPCRPWQPAAWSSRRLMHLSAHATGPACDGQQRLTSWVRARGLEAASPALLHLHTLRSAGAGTWHAASDGMRGHARKPTAMAALHLCATPLTAPACRHGQPASDDSTALPRAACLGVLLLLDITTHMCVWCTGLRLSHAPTCTDGHAGRRQRSRGQRSWMASSSLIQHARWLP